MNVRMLINFDFSIDVLRVMSAEKFFRWKFVFNIAHLRLSIVTLRFLFLSLQFRDWLLRQWHLFVWLVHFVHPSTKNKNTEYWTRESVVRTVSWSKRWFWVRSSSFSFDNCVISSSVRSYRQNSQILSEKFLSISPFSPLIHRIWSSNRWQSSPFHSFPNYVVQLDYHIRSRRRTSHSIIPHNENLLLIVWHNH